jgi:hypothetical protein
MNRVRTLLSTCVALACLVLVRPPLASAYQQAELKGTWEFNSIASGPGAPWWERARVGIAANGSAAGYSNWSDGGGDSIHATFALSPTGVVSIAGSSTFRGALDLGTTCMVITDTWDSGSPGTTEMKVGVKLAGSYGLADLRGDWEINTIASGPGAPWWQRGRVAVAADGSIAGLFTASDGEPDSARGSFTIAPDGVLQFTGSSTARGVLDAGKTIVVMSSTWTSYLPGTVDLSVGVKMAPAYVLADLAGTWELHSLATGPGAPWWNRGQIMLDAAGHFSGSMLQSGGGGGPTSGSYAITPSGVITRAGSTTARGVLDAGKTVMVWTDTWTTGSPGTTEILVAVRTSGGAVGVEADAAPGFVLEPVSPNPVRTGAPHVSFTLAAAAPAQLELLDVSGRRVVMRDAGTLGAGRHTLELDAGRRLAPGLYFVRLTQGTQAHMRRVVLL